MTTSCNQQPNLGIFGWSCTEGFTTTGQMYFKTCVEICFVTFFCWIIVTGFYILLRRCCILGEPKSRPKGYVPQGTFYSSLLGSACPKDHKKTFLFWASVLYFVSSIHRPSFSILFPHWLSTTVIPSYRIIRLPLLPLLPVTCYNPSEISSLTNSNVTYSPLL